MILVLLLAGATGVTACGSSNDAAIEDRQPTPTATTGLPATSSGTGGSASVKVSGAASGAFDDVTRCNLGGEHGMFFISLGGVLDGTPAELAVDQTRFTPDA